MFASKSTSLCRLAEDKVTGESETPLSKAQEGLHVESKVIELFKLGRRHSVDYSPI